VTGRRLSIEAGTDKLGQADRRPELLLLPEEIDPTTGAYLGNYPLALSQAGLVHAVLEVQKVLDA
jgi:GH15 family glucan-1,4-alpha-glucosidase